MFALAVVAFVVFVILWYTLGSIERFLLVAQLRENECGSENVREGETLRYVFHHGGLSYRATAHGLWVTCIVLLALYGLLALGLFMVGNLIDAMPWLMGLGAVLGALMAVAHRLKVILEHSVNREYGQKLKRLVEMAQSTKENALIVRWARQLADIHADICPNLARIRTEGLQQTDPMQLVKLMHLSRENNDLVLLTAGTKGTKCSTMPSSEFVDLQELTWGAPTRLRDDLNGLIWGMHLIALAGAFVAFRAVHVESSTVKMLAGGSLAAVAVVSVITQYTHAFSN